MKNKEEEKVIEESSLNDYYCFGCGVKLQSDKPSLKGYIPQKLFLDTSRPLLCKRCFRLQHYSEQDDTEEFNDTDLLTILDKAKEEKALIVYVLDLFSFESTFIKNINKKISHMNAIIVANKRDIMPKTVDDNKFKQYILKRLKEVNINALEVIITSASKNYNIDLLIKKIMEYRNNGNVYLVGSASCGKSSIINALLKNYSNETSNFITTSALPGTTMDIVEVPLDDNSYIFDTPGMTIKNSMLSFVDKKIINIITPRVEIKPRTFQLESKQALLFGGLAYFSFLEGPKSNYTVYLSNQVQINRSKLEKASTTFNNMLKGNQLKPTTSKITSCDDLEEHEFIINNDGNKYDVGINGLGWICLVGKGQKVSIKAPKGISVYLNDAKI